MSVGYTVQFKFTLGQTVKMDSIVGKVTCMTVDRAGVLWTHIQYVDGNAVVREGSFAEAELEAV